MESAPARVRPFRDDDEAEVIALWREVFPDPAPRNDPVLDLRRKRDTHPEFFLVATDGDDRVVGTAMGGFDGHRGWVYRLAVAPGRRRRGIGAALMRRLEAELDAAGCPKLNLQVRGDNRDVLAFYERLGYAREDRVSFGRVLPGAPGES